MEINVDWSQATVIKTNAYGKEYETGKAFINVEEKTKEYPCFSYTTDIITFSLIINNMTLRSSCLTNTSLNDPCEKERKGVEEFAGSRFITCFSHTDIEQVPFWANYGKSNKPKKILLQFKNFSNNIKDNLFMDYALIDNQRILFDSKEYAAHLNYRYLNKAVLDDKIYLDTYIDTLQIIDVKYVKPDSELLKQDYCAPIKLNIEQITGKENDNVIINGFDPTILGLYKSEAWKYEEETRILLTVNQPEFKKLSYIDLRLKPEIFADLKIILSPWDDGTLKQEVSSIITKSGLPETIKKSIIIQDSKLKNGINL